MPEGMFPAYTDGERRTVAAGVGGADSDVDRCLRSAMAGGLTPGFLRLSLETQTPTCEKQVVLWRVTNEVKVLGRVTNEGLSNRSLISCHNAS